VWALLHIIDPVLQVIHQALPARYDIILLYYCLMAKWTGLGNNTELFWSGLSQLASERLV
jgi:hypothetical protein